MSGELDLPERDVGSEDGREVEGRRSRLLMVVLEAPRLSVYPDVARAFRPGVGVRWAGQFTCVNAIHLFIRSHTCSFMCLLSCPFACALASPLAHLNSPFSFPINCPFIYLSPARSLTHSLTDPPIHSPTNPSCAYYPFTSPTEYYPFQYDTPQGLWVPILMRPHPRKVTPHGHFA